MSDEVKTTVRLPRAIVEQIKAQAKAEHRSVNGQLLHMLEETLDKQEPSRVCLIQKSQDSWDKNWGVGR